jgi:hypothetical protein
MGLATTHPATTNQTAVCSSLILMSVTLRSGCNRTSPVSSDPLL